MKAGVRILNKDVRGRLYGRLFTNSSYTREIKQNGFRSDERFTLRITISLMQAKLKVMSCVGSHILYIIERKRRTIGLLKQA